MRFLSLANRNMKEIYRDPITVLIGIGLPVLMLLLFISIGKNAPIEVFTVGSLVPGVIVFGFSFLSMFSSMLLAKDRGSAFLTRLLTSPLQPVEFILSYSLPYIPIALVQIAVCLLVGIFFGLTPNLGFLQSLIPLVPMSLVFIGIGMVFGSIFSENQVSAAGSILIVVCSLFSGAWMDLKMVGGMFESLGYSLPFIYAIEVGRSFLKGLPVNDLATPMLWVCGYMIGFLSLGTVFFWLKTKR